ncbi:transcription antiterminator [Streptococcus gallolyticus]|uniref:BglG family transcription antiterminator n=1 Tax=Streptococcus hepaticus TaxID=3349163 RepID=UPI001C95AA7C|nr:transcription antiterminator [Streptococcus gallolyticus]MBY5041527.1 transcription antiterminator [Streptococcus gallolyticus]
MIVLDKKSYALLSYLIQLEMPETIMKISKNLGQSRRKIYYHLEKINDSLPDGIQEVVAYPRIGLILSEEQKKACQDLMEGIDSYHYVMNAEERMLLLLTYIAVAQERVTIEKMMQLVEVSRNTILNDLTVIRERLSQEQYCLQLKVTKLKGYYLEGHPLSAIQYTYRLMDVLLTVGTNHYINLAREKLETIPSHAAFFSADRTAFLRQQIDGLVGLLGKKISPQDSWKLVNILPYLWMTYQNMDLSAAEKADVLADFSPAEQRLEYQVAAKIAENFQEEFVLELDEIETCIIAMLLLSFRKDRDVHVSSHDFDGIRTSLARFIEKITEDYQLTFENSAELLDQLVRHCKALLYRKTYGIFSTNPITALIQEEYGQLFYVTKACIPLLEEDWQLELSDDDIAYITIHLGAELKSAPVEEKKVHVMLVCDEVLAVRKLFLKQCQQALPMVTIDAVFTTEQLNSVRDILTSDLVISTSDGIDSPVPMLITKAILTDDEMIRIISFVDSQGKRQEEDFSQRLDYIIAGFVKDKQESYVLRREIEKIFREELLSEMTFVRHNN